MKKLLILLSIFALTLVFIPASKSEAYVACPMSAGAGEIVVDFPSRVTLFSSAPPHTFTHPIGDVLPAGKYEVTSVTYDAHSAHGGQGQATEIVNYTFNMSDGTSKSTTKWTTDIPESVDYQTDNMGTYTLGSKVVSISSMHGAIGFPNYQSVIPLCLKFKKVEDNTPKLQASCSVNPSSAKVNENVTWDANASGGNGTYTYSWSGADTDGKTSENFTKSYSSTGNKTATVTIKSGDQTATASCSADITSVPNPNLQVSCSASPSSVQTGQNVTWDANASGGNGTYSYSWNTGQNSENFTTSYNTNGSRTQTVTVTSAGNTASASCSVNVTDTPTSDPSVSCRVSDTKINKGDTVRFSADASNGKSPYNYDWDLDIDGDDQYEDVRFNNTGSYRARVTITDQNGKTSQSTCPTVVVEDEDDNDDDDLEISCRVSDTRIEEGDSVEYEVRINDGKSPYEINWRGDISGDDKKEKVRYNRSGTYEVSVKVEDDNGDTDTANCPDVKVEDEDDNDDNDRDINVTTSTNLNTPTGNLASINSVFLSQIPYTGPGDVAKGLGIVAVVAVWSAVVAMNFRKKRALKTVSNKIADFKEKNKLASTIK